MNCKMLTYNHPKKLNRLESFKPYVNCLHVCATTNMKVGVKERYQKEESPYITAPIITASSLINSLLGEWSTSEMKLKQFLKLSDVIQGKIKRESVYYSSFRRNQIDVLDTIRMLEVCGVNPDDLDDLSLSEKEEFFVQIWRELDRNSMFTQIRSILNKGIANKNENGQSIVQSLIDEAYRNEPMNKLDLTLNLDTIVLHGFYFMTSEQQRIFILLKNAGVKIVFLNLYDIRYPETFAFIEKFINEKHGWVNKETWLIESNTKEPLTIADKFLSDFEGVSIEHEKEKIAITDYPDFYAFLTDFDKSIESQKIRENKTFIAPNADALNNRLQEYYPELFKNNRRFLAYPIGQFLFQLHQMWDEQSKSLTITEGGLYECFASGWLYDNEKKQNARDYTKALHDILPFFKGCVTKKQWENRSAKLETIQKEVLMEFDMKTSNRFSKMMESPFARFSSFSLSIEESTQVISFINNVFHIAFKLFGTGEKRISLSDHFKKLRHLIFDSNPHMEKEIQNEERMLVEELNETLHSTPGVELFLVDDISSAISLYLSGNLPEDLNDDVLIKPFIEIDGETFKENPITHVTGLDENSLPYSEFKLPWPLQEKTFNALAMGNIPLSFQILRNENIKGITRYLVYNLFQFSNKVELSWMVQYEDKNNLDKAIYLSQLGLKPNTVQLNSDKQLVDNTKVEPISKKELDSFLVYPIDALAEFQFCPRRFYYSYITEEYSTFRSEFIHEFLYGNLLKSMMTLLRGNSNEEDVKNEVDKLFPHWTDFKRSILAKENFKYTPWAFKNFKGYTPYGENEFSNLRKLFLFPVLHNSNADEDSKMVAESIDSLYKKPETIIPTLRDEFERQLKEYPIQMEAKPSGKCRYCPHNDFCPAAFHPIDDKERRRNN